MGQGEAANVLEYVHSLLALFLAANFQRIFDVLRRVCFVPVFQEACDQA